MTLIVPTTTNFDWLEVRRALAAVIAAAAPKANVHAEWKLEFDPSSGLGRVTALMNGKSDHAGFVHSWFIGLASASENTSEGVNNTVGGGTVDYNLAFAVWGFFDYKSWRVKFGTSEVVADDSAERNATAFAEAETRSLMGYLRMNPTLGLNTGRVRYAYPLEIENSDTHPFSNGKTLIVVQTTVRLRVRESFA